MTFTYRFCVALALGALAPACGFPVDDSKYELEDANFDRIVEAFSEGNQDCKACVSGCVESINQCVATRGCTEFAECVREEANPAGQARCASEMVDVPFPVTLAYSDVVYCWMGCGSQCAVGTNWDCLDSYSVTQLPAKKAKVRQSFSYLCEKGAVQDAEVRFCLDGEEHCDGSTVTDATGTYTFDLPIDRNAPLAGWDGVRLVIGEGLALPHRLERNLPIWSDHIEFTRLMSSWCLDAGTRGLEAADDSAKWEAAIAVQVFDCHTSGAEGVALEVTTAPGTHILYTVGVANGVEYDRESSTASGDGSALVSNLPPGDHEIVARETKSGRMVGRAYVTVPTTDVTLYSLLPEPRE